MNDSKLLEDLKNGTALKTEFAPPPALIALVQSLAEGVATGRITSLACIIVGPMGQVQWPGFGMQTGELMLGAEMMRDDMKAAMRGGPASKILRAG